MKKQSGAAVLIIVVILLVAAILGLMYASNNSLLQQKSTTNQYTSSQSFQAAQAGLEFGMQYLQKNYATVTGSPTGGFINYGPSDASITNVTLGNNSRYSIVYTNPTANDYTLIKITSTGTNEDGTSTRVVSAFVKQKPVLSNVPTNPSTVLGTAFLAGSGATIINMQGNTTMVAGSTIGFQGAASTVTATGGSDKNHTGTDIQPNAAALSGLTPDQFFQSYFGENTSTVKASVANFYPSGSTPNLNGMTGTSIWVDGDYSQNGSVNIGTAAAPVVLIVNGNFDVGGGMTIYGFVYATGSLNTSNGTPRINGGFASSGNVSLQGNPTITYDSSVLNAARNLTSLYPKVPGSWKDF